MLSTLVLLATSDGPPASIGALVRTLGALVPGTIDGLLRDVIIVAVGADPEAERVADHAGCGVVERPSFDKALPAAVAQARSPIVFLVRAGAHVGRDFQDEVARILAASPDASPPLLLREAASGMLGRVLPDLAPAAGLIAAASALRPAPSFEALVRRIGKPRTLTARAVMVA